MNNRNEHEGVWPEPWPDIDTTLTQIADALSIAHADSVSEGLLPELAQRLDIIDTVLAALGIMREALTIELAARMEADEIEVPGVGYLTRIERTSSGTWKYDGAREQMFSDLKGALASRLAVDPATGEVNPALRRLITLTVDEMLEAISVGNPKAAFRKRYGLDPHDYRTAGDVTGYKVAVVHNEGEPS